MNSLFSTCSIQLLQTLSTQSPDVVDIITDFSSYVRFRGIEIKKIKLPVVLTGQIGQCCVHSDKVFIGTNGENNIFDEIHELFVWSLIDGSCRLFFQTNRNITDFVTCGDLLVVSLFPNREDKKFDSPTNITNDIMFFTTDGKFHHGFDFYPNDYEDDFMWNGHECAIDDALGVVYAFFEDGTKTFSFEGKHIRNETFDAEEYLCKTRDKKGNANLRHNNYFWVKNAIIESETKKIGKDMNINEYNYRVDYNFTPPTNSIRCGHVSKFNTLFLNDSTVIIIIDEWNLVAQGTPTGWTPFFLPIIAFAFQWLWDFASSWFGLPNLSKRQNVKTTTFACKTINIKANNETKESSGITATRTTSDLPEHAYIYCSTLDAYGRLYVFTSTHCHVYS